MGGVNRSLSNSYAILAHSQLTFSGKIISAVTGFIPCYGFLLWLFQKALRALRALKPLSTLRILEINNLNINYKNKRKNEKKFDFNDAAFGRSSKHERTGRSNGTFNGGGGNRHNSECGKNNFHGGNRFETER
jgi:hypothetical protein